MEYDSQLLERLEFLGDPIFPVIHTNCILESANPKQSTERPANVPAEGLFQIELILTGVRTSLISARSVTPRRAAKRLLSILE